MDTPTHTAAASQAPTGPPLSRGAVKLGQFLQRYGITQAAAAVILEASESSLHDWLTGAKRPNADSRWIIERWTGGTGDDADKVLAYEWSPAEFLQRLESIKPFKPGADLGGHP
jgi:hypothetical protein